MLYHRDMQQQAPSISSLLILTAAGFVGLGVVGFLSLLLVSLIGPWTMLLPIMALGGLYAAVIFRRRQRARDTSSLPPD